MIDKKLPEKLARIQLEIHNDGIYVAVYDNEDDRGLRTSFKVALEDVVKDYTSGYRFKDKGDDLIFELDCLVHYVLSIKNKNECEKEYKDSGFTDDFGTAME